MANEAGQGCTDRASKLNSYTFVSEGAPASQSGSVNKLEVFGSWDASDTMYFAFFTASGNDLTTVVGTRTAITSGTGLQECKTYNAPGDFTAFSVSQDEYLGLYNPQAQDYDGSGGAGVWYLITDNTDVSGVTFTLDADMLDALSADIVAVGLSIPVAMHHYKQQWGS